MNSASQQEMQELELDVVSLEFSLQFSNSLVPPEKKGQGICHGICRLCGDMEMMCIVLEHLKTKQFSTLTVYSDVYNNLVTIRIRGKLPVDSCIDFCMS